KKQKGVAHFRELPSILLHPFHNAHTQDEKIKKREGYLIKNEHTLNSKFLFPFIAKNHCHAHVWMSMQERDLAKGHSTCCININISPTPTNNRIYT
ncbi:hypothetical protein ACJX0J_015270, partial [Zea mays]